jgi:hypothetical protein
VDTLEILGHTDGVPVGGNGGNMDKKLAGVFNAGLAVAKLEAGSNVDLGLMRALAIRESWMKWIKMKHQNNPRLLDVNVRCYSAAQTIPPIAGMPITAEDNPVARRIEIRFTQLKNTDKNDDGPTEKVKERYPVKRLKNERY